MHQGVLQFGIALILKQQKSLEYCRYTHQLLVSSVINLLSGTVRVDASSSSVQQCLRAVESLKATNILIKFSVVIPEWFIRCLFRSLMINSLLKSYFYMKLIISNSC